LRGYYSAFLIFNTFAITFLLESYRQPPLFSIRKLMFNSKNVRLSHWTGMSKERMDFCISCRQSG